MKAHNKMLHSDGKSVTLHCHLRLDFRALGIMVPRFHFRDDGGDLIFAPHSHERPIGMLKVRITQEPLSNESPFF